MPVSPRAIGDVSHDAAPHFPETWPPAVQAVLDRRGSAPVRVFVDCVADLTHYGHARVFEQAKKAFPNVYLIVGINGDVDVHAHKGITVLNEAERRESVYHFKWVDEVLPVASPWVLSEAFLAEHDIDFVAHDDIPYTAGAGTDGDVYGLVKRLGKFYPTARTEGVSTTELVSRILRGRQEYFARNLSRGTSREELGLGPVEAVAVRLRASVGSGIVDVGLPVLFGGLAFTLGLLVGQGKLRLWH